MADYRYNLQEPGDFSLSDVFLFSYRKGEGDNPFGLEIKSLITEINIFESIGSKSITGNIVMSDGHNVPEDLPLTGLERLEFKFYTPSNISNTSYDFTSETGSPVYVYKIDSRKRVNQSAQVYVIHFCSKEFYFNEKNRVNVSLNGSYENIALELIRNKEYLNSKKRLFLEETKSSFKYVFPNVRPLQAIDMIAEEAISKQYKNAGYLFFENKQGLHFRSYESLIAYNGIRVREPVEYFVVETGSVRGGGGNLPIQDTMRRIRKYDIVEQYNTLKSMRIGAFASRLHTVDFFNKNVNFYDYNYFDDYKDYFHLQGDAFNEKTDNFHILPDTPSDEFGKGLNEYPSKQYYYSTTANLHNDFKTPSYENIVRQREAQHALRNSIVLKLEIAGNTTIDAGDVIYIEVPQVKSAPRGEDLFLSGNYMIRHMRHNISLLSNKHMTTMEVVKDSLRTNYPAVQSSSDNTFIGREAEKETYNINVIEASQNLT